ncbi:hypothetical protein O9993_18815 [Vibrio lentus]|nr:hypothetical protein [Vibrio lentus]
MVTPRRCIRRASGRALKHNLKNLKDGDEVIIPNGNTCELSQVTITANDITIKAEQAGSAWITGLIQFELKGDDITLLDGLVFTEGGPTNVSWRSTYDG